MPNEDYIDTKGAAQRWDVSESYIRKLIRQQRVVAKKVRRDWVVGVESLDEYMRGPRKVGRPPIDKPNK